MQAAVTGGAALVISAAPNAQYLTKTVKSMNLHEYQGKQLFAEYGLPVSKGYAVDTPEEAAEACDKIGGSEWVVKAQVHAGGRGKAGGVKLVRSKEDAKAFAQQWLGKRLVTYQTDANGQPVTKILVESCTDIAKELYLGAVVDRSSRRIVFMASTEGGVDIEKIAHDTPEKILKATIDPLVGAQPFQGRELAFQLGLEGKQVAQFAKIFVGLAKLFQDHDLALLEVNPLVIKADGDLHCLDAKINIDANAMYRQPKLKTFHDPSQDDPREAHAGKFELNYVALEGNIGCMVNGAGLAMGTMDIVNLHGGKPANFLDVGGGATERARNRSVQDHPVRHQRRCSTGQHLRRHRSLRHDCRRHHRRRERSWRENPGCCAP